MTKKILIDARLYGPQKTGIGRYTKNLLLALKKNKKFKNYTFGLIVKTEDLDTVKQDLKTSYLYYPTDISHYSPDEQIKLPKLLSSLSPDLVHFTHFNKPLFYFGKSLLTVHDLIKHFFKGQETSTRHPLFYWPKYFAYRLFTDINIRLNPVLVPSIYWRNFIIHHYHKDPQTVTVTYEAVDPKFLQHNPQSTVLPQDYVIYTGNLYPHKNIEVILRALKYLPDLNLKIICARSAFTARVQKLTDRLGVSGQVEFLGYVPDDQFPSLYQNALALIHPSFMEGFSLTGLEAMSLSCPVISSNASCLPEIYQSSVLYFDPKNEKELVNQVNILRNDPNLRHKLIKLGHLQVSKYSWSKTASATISVYEKILG